MATLTVEGVHFRLRAGLDPERAQPLLAGALAALARGDAPDEKSGRRKALHRLALAGGGPDHLLKVNRYGLWDGVRRRVAGSKARRELERAERAAARDLPTPIPLAAGERRRAGVLRACYLLVPIVPGARDLRRVLEHEPPHGAERRALARAFGSLARRMHDAGVFQDDFAPNNFLVGREPEDLRVIDFERAELQDRVGGPVRARMLAKLSREVPDASAADRARFLAAYAGGGGAWRELWPKLEAETARLARRDVARLVRVTTRPGRRFALLRAGGWRGYRRALVEPAALAATLDAVRAAPARALAGGLALHEAEGHWCLDTGPLSRRSGRDVWARAHYLARRRLGPEPSALAWRGGRALLLFPGAAPRPLAGGGLAALTVFLDRILGLGELRAPAPIGFAGAAPQLLWAGAFEPTGRRLAGRRAESRRRARALLGP